jgi:5'-3' exonuclease
MGIRGFNSKLNSIGIKGTLLDLSNLDNMNTKRVIVVDILNFYYKSVRSKSLKIQYKPHLHGIFNLLSFLRKRGFIPISVFDGKPPISKAHIINARKQHYKNYVENTAEKGGDMHTVTNISRDQINEIMALLDILGLPYVKHDDYEAELVCAWMIRESKGRIFAALGDDWDLMLLGCPVLRNLNFKTNTVEYFNPVEICNKLELTHEGFINFILLLGTDYCTRIIGLDTIELFNILKMNNGVIEDTIEFIRQNYPTGVKIPNVDYSNVKKHYKLPDVDFMNYASHMEMVQTLITYYLHLEDEDDPGIIHREAFVKLRNKLIGLLQIKDFIVSEKLVDIYPKCYQKR